MSPMIVKGDGTAEPFRLEKLEESLAHSGAEPSLATAVARKVELTVREGMTTSEIYKEAFAELRREEKTAAARYSMRRAIFELGPTGFPFEEYVMHLMRSRGYTTELPPLLKGRCAEHEVDVLLKKDGRTIAAELKFHNAPGFKTDIKTALYIRARLTDLEEGAAARGEPCAIDEGWLVTNTKFTSNAIAYAECAGLTLIGWSYPEKGNLSDIIRETGVYPITVLTSLSRAEKDTLLASGIPLCSMVASNPESLTKAGIAAKKHAAVVKESTALCRV